LLCLISPFKFLRWFIKFVRCFLFSSAPQPLHLDMSPNTLGVLDYLLRIFSSLLCYPIRHTSNLLTMTKHFNYISNLIYPLFCRFRVLRSSSFMTMSISSMAILPFCLTKCICHEAARPRHAYPYRNVVKYAIFSFSHISLATFFRHLQQRNLESKAVRISKFSVCFQCSFLLLLCQASLRIDELRFVVKQ
jgi:hypothetical protein